MIRLDRTAVAAVTLALAVPASASADDFRTPDAVDAATRTPAPTDLRTPDGVEGTGTRTAPQVAPVRVVAVPQDGFDWGDAGIGAAGGVALVVLGMGTVMATGHQRRRTRLPVA